MVGAKIWHMGPALDQFDLQLLNLIQVDADRTADSLSLDVPLSPSAIARRLRRLRRDGVIDRTIAQIAPAFAENRIRVLAMLQIGDHGEHQSIRALEGRLSACPAVQFCFELAGSIDIIVMLDFATMRDFNEQFRRLISDDPTIHRFECYFIKREMRFAPFIDVAGTFGGQ
jgi:Lrp/AsnC family leucine-responsive transcriptional regulator